MLPMVGCRSGGGSVGWMRRRRLEPLLSLAVVASDGGMCSFLLLQLLTGAVVTARESPPEVVMATMAVAVAVAESQNGPLHGTRNERESVLSEGW